MLVLAPYVLLIDRREKEEYEEQRENKRLSYFVLFFDI